MTEEPAWVLIDEVVRERFWYRRGEMRRNGERPGRDRGMTNSLSVGLGARTKGATLLDAGSDMEAARPQAGGDPSDQPQSADVMRLLMRFYPSDRQGEKDILGGEIASAEVFAFPAFHIGSTGQE